MTTQHMRTVIQLCTLIAVMQVSPIVYGDDCNYIRDVPYTIGESGHYCLFKSVSLSKQKNVAYAIVITANDVVLDLQGNSLNGAGQGTGVAAIQRQNLIVKNGIISNYETGISFMSMRPEPVARNNKIQKLRILDSTNIGIYSVGENVLIEDNTIERTGGAVGAMIPGYIPGSATAIHSIGSGAVIRRNSILETSSHAAGIAYGIYLDNCKNTRVENNTIVGHGDGVGISYQSTCDIVFKDNAISKVTTPYSKHHSSNYK